MQQNSATRSKARRSSSLSQYALDIGQLDSDAQFDLTAQIARPQLQRVLSQDIDGPSDFTQNMDMWLRGGNSVSSRNPAQVPGHVSATVDTRSTTEDQGIREQDLDYRSNGPSEYQYDERTESHHTPEQSPPRESVWNRVSSSGDPVSVRRMSSSTPKSSKAWPRQDRLSTREEPKQSDDGAGYFAVRGSPQEPGFTSVLVDDTGAFSPRRPPSSPSLASSPKRAIPQQMFDQRVASIENTYLANTKDFSARLYTLEMKNRQLEGLNQSLAAEIARQRKEREDENMRYISLKASIMRMRKSLPKTGTEDFDDDDAVHDMLRDLQNDSQEHQLALRIANMERDHSEKQHLLSMQQLRQHGEEQTHEHTKQLGRLREELNSAQHARETAEKAVKDCREELDGRTNTVMVQLRKLQDEMIAMRAVQPSQAISNPSAGPDAKPASQLPLAVTENTIHKQFQGDPRSTQAAPERMTTNSMKANFQTLESPGTTQRQLEHEQAQIASRPIEMDRVQAGSRKDLNEAKENLRELAARLRDARAKLDASNADRDQAQEALRSSCAKNEQLMAELAMQRKSNESVDAKISDALMQRENFWRQKVNSLEEERRMMSKALLHQWGRKELGIGSPQAYMYQSTCRSAVDEREAAL